MKSLMLAACLLPSAASAQIPARRGHAFAQLVMASGLTEAPTPPAAVAGTPSKRAEILDIEPIVDENALLLDVEPVVPGPGDRVFDDRDSLETIWARLHYDRDLNERLDAARKLRLHVATPRGRWALLKVLQDPMQPVVLRMECAKTLSWSEKDESVAAALLSVATAFSGSLELKAICIRSLHRMTTLPGVKAELKGIFSAQFQHESLRRAAAWALYPFPRSLR